MTIHFRDSSMSETRTVCGLDVVADMDWSRDDLDLWPVADRCRECCRALRLPVVYTIPDDNRATVEEKLAKLNRRAEKLGVPPVTMTWTHARTETWKVEKVEGEPEFGYYEYARQWFSVEVSGAEVRLPGWEFVATLHHTTEGNIIAGLPGQDVPREYRNAPSACHHCKTARRRSATYLLRETATGNVVQVGNTCLADFLGGDPARLASWAEALGAFDSWFLALDPELRGTRAETSFSLESFLFAVAAVVRVDGWTSKKRASETGETASAGMAWSYLTAPSGSKSFREMERKYSTEPDADKSMVTLVSAWATETLGAETTRELNDYEHNLSVVVRSGLVNRRVSGLAASLLQAYRRATQVAEERASAAAGPESNYVGAMGERLRSIPVEVMAVIPMPPTEFGPRELVKLRDDAGNLFAWFTGQTGTFCFPTADGTFDLTTARYLVAGDRLWLTGTVKRHSTFAGAKQTELSRCALATVAPVEKVKKAKKVKVSE